MQSDTTRGPLVQGHLSEISKAWEHLTNLLGQKHQQYSSTANLWQQYVDAKQNVGRVLDDVAPLTKQGVVCKSQPDVKKALDTHKASIENTYCILCWVIFAMVFAQPFHLQNFSSHFKFTQTQLFTLVFTFINENIMIWTNFTDD